jgi:uncharacterized protein
MPIKFIFAITFIMGAYIGVSLYIKKRVLQAFNWSPSKKATILHLGIFLGIPITSSVLSRATIPFVTTFFGFLFFLGLGFVLFFTLALFLFDLSNLIIKKYKKRRVTHPNNYFSHRKVVLYGASFSIIMVLYSFLEARTLTTEQITIKTGKLPISTKFLRIVHISDIHFSSIAGDEFAKRIASIISPLQPDIIVHTGDLVDRGITDWNKITATLRGLKAPFGKFAVTGNHDAISNLDYSIKFHKDSGFKLIRNSVVYLDQLNMAIAGVDDPMVLNATGESVNESKLLKAINKSRFTLLLKHRPDVIKQSIGQFDLQLSGHTHGGQIFPAILIVKLIFKYLTGFYDLGKGSLLYINRGTGTWGPPLRLFSPPEITVIDLIHR